MSRSRLAGYGAAALLLTCLADDGPLRCATSPGRVRLVCAHAKTGTYLTQGVVALVAALCGEVLLLERDAVGCNGWMDALGNPPLAPPPDLPPPYAAAFAALAAKPARPPPADRRVLNFVRDPFDLVVSLALYSWRGDEARHGVQRDGPEHRELVARSRGGGWPPTSVLPLLDCAGAAAEAGAADRACESYGAYLRRLADGGGGMRAVVLATAFRVLRDPFSAHILHRLNSSAAAARRDPAARSVCLERFMAGGARFRAGWREALAHLDVAPAAIAPLVARIAAEHDPSSRVTAHMTAPSLAPVGSRERAALIEAAREIDAAWFDGELAALAEHIGCAESPDLPAPDEERLARLGASEDRDTC